MFAISGKPPGYDRVRNAEIGNKDFELDVLEEVFYNRRDRLIVRLAKDFFPFFSGLQLPGEGLFFFFLQPAGPRTG